MSDVSEEALASLHYWHLTSDIYSSLSATNRNRGKGGMLPQHSQSKAQIREQ
jgi:hypothetical protein